MGALIVSYFVDGIMDARNALWDGLLLVLKRNGRVTLDDVPEEVSREYIESVLDEMTEQGWFERATEDGETVWRPGELASLLRFSGEPGR